MPYNYHIEEAQGLVISAALDRVTYAEIRDHQDRLLLDSHFKPNFNQLIDGTRTTALDLSGEEARTIAFRRIFSVTSRRAYVSPGPAVPGVGLLMAAYQEARTVSSRMRVFYNFPSAFDWLRLEADQLEIAAR
jgi:hypothetical protein